MTAPHLDPFSESVAAYALGALDASEQQAFEAHLASCDECQRDLAELQRVTAGLGLGAEAEAPPASLKARTMARATAQPQVKPVTAAPARSIGGPPAMPRGSSYGWLAMAASLAFVAAGIYAWSLRSQLNVVSQTVAELSDRANTLRNNLDEARREAARLSQVVDIVRGPGTVLVNLTGTAAAPSAQGRAYFNPALGMVVSTDQLPGLRPGRAYQLWMVVPEKKPISAGVFSVSATGAATFKATVPGALVIPAGTAVTVAVTEEPAGGSDGPTSAILLAGEMRAR